MESMFPKRILVSFFVFAAFFIAARTIFAQTFDSSNSGALQINLLEQKQIFQQKLQQLSSQKEKQLLKKIDTKIASLSAKRANEMSISLQKLSTLLNKMIQKEHTFSQQEIDTSHFDTASISAQTALSTALQLVQTQQKKVYVIPTDNETTLKSSASATLIQLQSDLTALYTAVSDAKQQVLQVAKELRNMRKGGRGRTNGTNNATNSANE